MKENPISGCLGNILLFKQQYSTYILFNFIYVHSAGRLPVPLTKWTCKKLNNIHRQHSKINHLSRTGLQEQSTCVSF